MKIRYAKIATIFLACLVLISGCAKKSEQKTPEDPQPKQELSDNKPSQKDKCFSNWQCSNWSECNDLNKKTRICQDKNKCGDLTNKPEESQECTKEKEIDLKPLGPFKIEISGDVSCVKETSQALNLLKDKAKTHYDVVTKYVGIIECTEAGSGMFAQENPPRYKVGKSTREEGTTWYAGTIAHDSCHSKQYHDYLYDHPLEEVPSLVWTGEQAEVQCLDVQYDALKKMGASQDTLDYIENIKSSKYWEVEYDNRWW